MDRKLKRWEMALMLGLPGGSREKLGRSIAFAASLGVEHISSYILKVEPGS